MKFTSKVTLCVLTGAALLFTACKKSTTKPLATAAVIDYNALSVKVAINLYQAITSQNGGININNGIQTPANNAVNQNSLALYDNTQCGFTTEPVSRFNSTSGDTIKTEVIHYKFVSTCGTTYNDGYTVSSADTTITGSSIFRNFKVVDQDYVVQALDKTYKLISMNGSLNAKTNYSRFTGPFYDSSIKLVNSDTVLTTQQYVLKGLVIDITSGVADITSGTATFNDLNKEIDVYTPGGKIYGDSGIIEFIGNHTVKVTFSNGQVFIVHLLDYTGVQG